MNIRRNPAKTINDLPYGLIVSIDHGTESNEEWINVSIVKSNDDIIPFASLLSYRKCTERVFVVGYTKAPKGFGPLLYDVAMEYATKLGSSLCSDRSSVSVSAKKVWDTYYSRRDIKKILYPPQLDRTLSIDKDNKSLAVSYRKKPDVILSDIVVMKNIVTKNPPTEGYIDKKNGKYSNVYLYENHVEVVLKIENERTRFGDILTVDFSKEILIVAREIATPEIKIHLPEITRLSVKKLDYPESYEFMYSMPLYAPYKTGFFSKLDNDLLDLESKKSYWIDTVKTIDKAKEIIEKHSPQMFTDSRFEDIYGHDLERKGMFIRRDNLAKDRQGNIILLDPIYCVVDIHKMFDYCNMKSSAISKYISAITYESR